MAQLNPPYFLALDVDDVQKARQIVAGVAPFIGGIKLGPRLCLRYGADLIGEMAKVKPVFVDCKFFDIPNTMEAAVRATFVAGASYATVHAQSGREALSRLAEVEAELSRQRPFKILAVTVLTSFTKGTLPPVVKDIPLVDQVSALAKLTIESGLTGIVCSPEEVARLRMENKSAYLVVPGIRMGQVAGDDQTRIAGPAETLSAGASALVVGRPIVDAKDPAAAAKTFFDACKMVK